MNKKKARVVKKATEVAPKKLVTKKFLLGVADKIYDPKTGAFMKLCNGYLFTKDVKKGEVLHCGIGELYFQLTGKHPTTTASETTNFIVACSTIAKPQVHYGKEEQQFLQVEKFLLTLEKSNFRDHLLEKMIEARNAVNERRAAVRREKVNNFLFQIEAIIGENDDDAVDSPRAFKARAKAVAAQMRRAAMLLPK